MNCWLRQSLSDRFLFFRYKLMLFRLVFVNCAILLKMSPMSKCSALSYIESSMTLSLWALLCISMTIKLFAFDQCRPTHRMNRTVTLTRTMSYDSALGLPLSTFVHRYRHLPSSSLSHTFTVTIIHRHRHHCHLHLHRHLPYCQHRLMLTATNITLLLL